MLRSSRLIRGLVSRRESYYGLEGLEQRVLLAADLASAAVTQPVQDNLGAAGSAGVAATQQVLNVATASSTSVSADQTNPSTGRTFYVSTTGNDGNAGSPTQPFQSINRAVHALQPGDTLYIRGGTYAESLIDNIPSGTSANSMVTIAAYPGETVTLQPLSGARVLEFYNQQYVHITGLILDGSHVHDVVKFYRPSSYITIDNSEIMNGSHDGILGAGSNITFSNLSIHDNADEGIYWEGDNTVVEHSTIFNNDTGINFWGDDTSGGAVGHNVARYNTIYDNKISSGTQRGDGILVGTNLSTGTGADIYNNTIYGNDVGIYLTYNFTYGTIANNTVYNNSNANGDGVGIWITQFASNATIANNQVSGNQMADLLDNGSNTQQVLDPATGSNGSTSASTDQANSVPSSGSVSSTGNSSSATTATDQTNSVPSSAIVPSSGRTFYVSTTGNDSSAGSANQPFLSINRAVQTLQPGDTLYIRGGTYAESLIHNIPSGTSATSMVTIAAYPGETVTLRPLSGDRVLEFYNQQYIHITGLILDGSHIQHDVVKFYRPSNYITIDNSEIMNGNHNGILGEGSYITFSHVSVHDNPHEGIYWEGDHTIVEYSTIYNNDSGINFWDANTSGGPIGNNIARYNTVYHNKIYSGTQRGDGISVGTNLPGGTGADIYNNVIYDNDVGIYLTYNFNYGTVSNNTVYNNSSVFGDGVGIYVTPFASNATIANNQVYGNQMTDILDDGVNTTRVNN